MFAGTFLSNLASSWRLWLVLAVVAAFLGVSALANSRGKEIRVLQAEKTSLQTQLTAAGDLLREQNRGIEALKAASDAQASRAAKAAKAAERALGAANARAEALTRVQVPAACPAALEWLRDQVDQAETARGAQ